MCSFCGKERRGRLIWLGRCSCVSGRSDRHHDISLYSKYFLYRWFWPSSLQKPQISASQKSERPSLGGTGEREARGGWHLEVQSQELQQEMGSWGVLAVKATTSSGFLMLFGCWQLRCVSWIWLFSLLETGARVTWNMKHALKFLGVDSQRNLHKMLQKAKQ